MKEFQVQRLKNGRGDNHLVAVIEEAIPDMVIGSVLIIPYAEGFKDPIKVVLLTNENGIPQTANDVFAIVLEYIYDTSN